LTENAEERLEYLRTFGGGRVLETKLLTMQRYVEAAKVQCADGRPADGAKALERIPNPTPWELQLAADLFLTSAVSTSALGDVAEYVGALQAALQVLDRIVEMPGDVLEEPVLGRPQQQDAWPSATPSKASLDEYKRHARLVLVHIHLELVMSADADVRRSSLEKVGSASLGDCSVFALLARKERLLDMRPEVLSYQEYIAKDVSAWIPSVIQVLGELDAIASLVRSALRGGEHDRSKMHEVEQSLGLDNSRGAGVCCILRARRVLLNKVAGAPPSDEESSEHENASQDELLVPVNRSHARQLLEQVLVRARLDLLMVLREALAGCDSDSWAPHLKLGSKLAACGAVKSAQALLPQLSVQLQDRAWLSENAAETACQEVEEALIAMTTVFGSRLLHSAFRAGFSIEFMMQVDMAMFAHAGIMQQRWLEAEEDRKDAETLFRIQQINEAANMERANGKLLTDCLLPWHPPMAWDTAGFARFSFLREALRCSRLGLRLVACLFNLQFLRCQTVICGLPAPSTSWNLIEESLVEAVIALTLPSQTEVKKSCKGKHVRPSGYVKRSCYFPKWRAARLVKFKRVYTNTIDPREILKFALRICPCILAPGLQDPCLEGLHKRAIIMVSCVLFNLVVAWADPPPNLWDFGIQDDLSALVPAIPFAECAIWRAHEESNSLFALQEGGPLLGMTATALQKMMGAGSHQLTKVEVDRSGVCSIPTAPLNEDGMQNKFNRGMECLRGARCRVAQEQRTRDGTAPGWTPNPQAQAFVSVWADVVKSSLAKSTADTAGVELKDDSAEREELAAAVLIAHIRAVLCLPPIPIAPLAQTDLLDPLQRQNRYSEYTETWSARSYHRRAVFRGEVMLFSPLSLSEEEFRTTRDALRQFAVYYQEDVMIELIRADLKTSELQDRIQEWEREHFANPLFPQTRLRLRDALVSLSNATAALEACLQSIDLSRRWADALQLICTSSKPPPDTRFSPEVQSSPTDQGEGQLEQSAGIALAHYGHDDCRAEREVCGLGSDGGTGVPEAASQLAMLVSSLHATATFADVEMAAPQLPPPPFQILYGPPPPGTVVGHIVRVPPPLQLHPFHPGQLPAAQTGPLPPPWLPRPGPPQTGGLMSPEGVVFLQAFPAPDSGESAMGAQAQCPGPLPWLQPAGPGFFQGTGQAASSGMSLEAGHQGPHQLANGHGFELGASVHDGSGVGDTGQYPATVSTINCTGGFGMGGFSSAVGSTPGFVQGGVHSSSTTMMGDARVGAAPELEANLNSGMLPAFGTVRAAAAHTAQAHDPGASRGVGDDEDEEDGDGGLEWQLVAGDRKNMRVRRHGGRPAARGLRLQ